MKMLLSRFPEEKVQKYNLNALSVDGWVYIEIRKGMYVLKQAGLLANQLLQTRLAPFGYYPARHTPGLWLYHIFRERFCSQVRGQAARWPSQKRFAENLRTYNGLGRNGILKHNFEKVLQNRTCDNSMPGYVSNILSKFQHDAPKHPQSTSSRYVTPVYGANTQYATKYEILPLTAQQCLTIQKVTGSVLYYARAVDPTVLMPLNDIATDQTQATEKHRPPPINC
jgi:hypothetical protein